MMNESIRKITAGVIALVSLCLASCVSTRETPLPDATVLSRKSAARTSRVVPSFAAMTPGKAQFGMIGAAAMISTGNKIIRDNRVEDPADWISQELAIAMTKKYGTTSAGKRTILDESPAAIAQACAGADYALDVRTINWSFVYFPVNWGTYRVIYSAKLRLIDCKTGKVVAEGFHARIPEKTEQSPGYDDLVDKGAAGLKRELKIGAAEALQHFKTDILKL